jgi:uncharacterized protein
MKSKRERLRRALERRGRIVLGFSGGKDSFFLLREATRTLGADNVFPYFVRTPFTGEASLERLAYFREFLPFPLREVRVDLLAAARLRRNPRDRCFWCKRRMFTALKAEARRLGIAHVADGSTASDLGEHRPGRLALERLGVISPLRESGITGGEIAASLKRAGVAERLLFSSTCLATRFPYGHPLHRGEIAAIGQVENFLISRGIVPLRVRHIPDGVRVETAPARFQSLLALKSEFLPFCRERGFRFVTLDLGGIKSGPWD